MTFPTICGEGQLSSTAVLPLCSLGFLLFRFPKISKKDAGQTLAGCRRSDEIRSNSLRQSRGNDDSPCFMLRVVRLFASRPYVTIRGFPAAKGWPAVDAGGTLGLHPFRLVGREAVDVDGLPAQLSTFCYG